MKINIETERLIVRPFNNQDASALLSARNSEFVNRYNIYPQVSLQEFRDELNRTDANVFILKDSGLPIGCLYIKDDPFRYQTGSYEIAGWFDERFANHHFASEALPCILDAVFEKDGVNRVAFHVFVKNGASNRLMEKFGFKREGCLCEALKDKFGEFVDIVIYSISKRDYKKL